MFSGIVEETATVLDLAQASYGMSLKVSSSLDHSRTKIGHSIAIDGVCLTVTGCSAGGVLEFDVIPESLERTTLGSLQQGSSVNLERAMLLGDRVHGHLVTGHVDGTTSLLSVDRNCVDRNCVDQDSVDQDYTKYVFELPAGHTQYFAEKGSICLAGVSLTVGRVFESEFEVFLVPHTLNATTFGTLRAGMRANFEIDMVARYLERLYSNSATESSDG